MNQIFPSKFFTRAKPGTACSAFQPAFEYLPPHQRRLELLENRAHQSNLVLEGERVSFTSAREISHASFQTGVGAGVRSTFRGFTVHQSKLHPAQIPLAFETRMWIEHSNGVVHFELVPLVDDPGLLRVVYPAPFELSAIDAQCYTVLPMMQGSLIPNNWGEAVHTHSQGLLYSRAAYMPWWGQVDHRAGALTIVDTPWDAGYRLDHPVGGPTRLVPVWHASLGSLRYNRKMQVHFIEDGDYNDLAKVYRACAREHGLLRTLAEKVHAKPVLEKLVGTPVVHTGICINIQPESVYYNANDLTANTSLTTFAETADLLQKLRQNGVERAYVHLDGWGQRGYDNLHPDVLPPCQAAGGWDGFRQLVDTCHELGYLIITHDQYRDYFLDAATYDPQQAMHNESGEPPEVAVWYGGAQSFLCASLAPYYVRRNYTRFDQENIALDGAYLDVFAVVELDECFHPDHTMSRKECMEYRLLCFDYLGTQGRIVSSEESIDFAVPHLDLVHHGPYALDPDYDNCPARGIPVPLFNLVYHDCLILPWTLTKGGWGIPEGESGLLHAYLNGGTGYLSLDADAEEIERVQALCDFHKRVCVCGNGAARVHRRQSAPAARHLRQRDQRRGGFRPGQRQDRRLIQSLTRAPSR